MADLIPPDAPASPAPATKAVTVIQVPKPLLAATTVSLAPEVFTRRDALLTEMAALTTVTADNVQQALECGKKAGALLRDTETFRKAAAAPYKKICDQLMALEKQISTDLEPAQAALRKKLNDYEKARQAEAERIRRENEAAQQKAVEQALAERAQREADEQAAADDLGAVVTAPAEPEPLQVAMPVAQVVPERAYGMEVRRVLKHEIVDLAALPAAWLMPNESAITAYQREHAATLKALIAEATPGADGTRCVVVQGVSFTLDSVTAL